MTNPHGTPTMTGETAARPHNPACHVRHTPPVFGVAGIARTKVRASSGSTSSRVSMFARQRSDHGDMLRAERWYCPCAARHEAGHAIAGALFGFEVESMSVDRARIGGGQNIAGETHIAIPVKGGFPTLVVLFAGALAEAGHDDAQNIAGGIGSDFAEAMDILRQYPERDREEIAASAITEAARIVRTYTAAIDTLALLLTEAGTLPGSIVADVLTAHQVATRRPSRLLSVTVTRRVARRRAPIIVIQRTSPS